MVLFPNNKYHGLFLKDKIVMVRTSFSNLFDLGVKGQMNVMMVRDTSSNVNAPTYQISLTYLERQKVMARTSFPIILPLFDLGVKGQGQTNVMMVRDTPSYSHTSTYQISLTYLERQKSYGPGQASPI